MGSDRTSPSSPTGDAYVPGVCNINRAEIAKRKKAGYFGLSITVLVIVLLFILNPPRAVNLVVFLPAFVACIGFLQAKAKFCVGYAAAGQQNATEGSKHASVIHNTKAMQKDKLRAQRMNIQAFVIALIVSIAALLIR